MIHTVQTAAIAELEELIMMAIIETSSELVKEKVSISIAEEANGKQNKKDVSMVREVLKGMRVIQEKAK